MSRKRGKKQKAVVAAIPEDILAEGSGPVAADAIATVEDVGTTDDIATTEDVVTADDVVATAERAPALTSDAEPPLARPHDSDIVTAAELAEAMETAGSDDVELGDGDADGGLDASGEDLDDAVDGEGGEGEGDDDADGVIIFPTSAATMDAVQLKHLVEALIFASDRPLTVQRLRQLTRVGDVRRLEQSLVQIAEDYQERGLILQQVSGGYQFRTRTQFSAWVQQLIAGRPVRLSRAQLETLAIIAYRQPITRPEIDDIRGVDSSATLKLLIDRMLIRVLGKREEVGRPMLYGTTKEFLDFFSLGDLRELPTLREYSELTAESRKVMSDRLGIPPDGPDSSGSGGGGSDGGDSGGGGSDGGDSGGGSSGGGDTGGGGSGGAPIPGFDDGDVPDDGGAPAHASADDLGDAMAALHTEALEDALESETIAPDAIATEAVLAAEDAPVADAADQDGGWVEDNDGWPAGSQRITVADEAHIPVIAPNDHRPVERPVMDSNVIGAGALDDNHGDAAPAAGHGEPAAE